MGAACSNCDTVYTRTETSRACRRGGRNSSVHATGRLPVDVFRHFLRRPGDLLPVDASEHAGGSVAQKTLLRAVENAYDLADHDCRRRFDLQPAGDLWYRVHGARNHPTRTRRDEGARTRGAGISVRVIRIGVGVGGNFFSRTV